MAVQMHEVEVWVMVNADGEYVAHEDDASLAEAYADRIGDITEAAGLRRVRVTVTVPLPTPFELAGQVAVEEQPGELKVA